MKYIFTFLLAVNIFSVSAQVMLDTGFIEKMICYNEAFKSFKKIKVTHYWKSISKGGYTYIPDTTSKAMDEETYQNGHLYHYIKSSDLTKADSTFKETSYVYNPDMSLKYIDITYYPNDTNSWDINEELRKVDAQGNIVGRRFNSKFGEKVSVRLVPEINHDTTIFKYYDINGNFLESDTGISNNGIRKEISALNKSDTTITYKIVTNKKYKIVNIHASYTNELDFFIGDTLQFILYPNTTMVDSIKYFYAKDGSYIAYYNYYDTLSHKLISSNICNFDRDKTLLSCNYKHYGSYGEADNYDDVIYKNVSKLEVLSEYKKDIRGYIIEETVNKYSSLGLLYQIYYNRIDPYNINDNRTVLETIKYEITK